MPMSRRIGKPKRVYLDLTHVGRHVTGIERIAIELFEKVEFQDADIVPVRSKNLISLIFKQQVLFPLLALLQPHAKFVFPGFPPSPLMQLFRDRVVLYVHDLFLVTRRHDLSLKAKLYMAWPFQRAVTHLRHFLVNSEKTRAELEPFVAPDASIRLYRPPVRNVFSLSPGTRGQRDSESAALRLVAVGTVEPRKNFSYAAQIRDALAGQNRGAVTLDIIGRAGWGGVAEHLAEREGINLRGYLSLADAGAVIENADIYLCTSHDEGLGLPLLEVQYAGLTVVAPDQPVFREVLRESAIYIPPGDAEAAARVIRSALSQPGWRQKSVKAAQFNLERWNSAAFSDATRARAMFSELSDAPPATRPERIRVKST